MNISVIGLGKLGLPIAACFAKAGHRVVGLDTNQKVIDTLQAGGCPVDETGLIDLLNSISPVCDYTGYPALTFTSSYDDIRRCQLHFIVVPTPSNEDGTFSLKYVIDAVECIGHAIQSTKHRHVIVITSTVMPGATGGEIRGALERTTGCFVGKNIGLCYSPEFVALGSVIKDFTSPDFCLIGESDKASGDAIEYAYRSVYHINWGWHHKFVHTNWVNAELAKLSLNTYITTKITYANTLAQICENLPGADVDEVTRAIGMDSRIGSKYLKAGAPYGGPCFPRDNRALDTLIKREVSEWSLPEMVDTCNLAFKEHVYDMLHEAKSICIVGTSYKLGTAVTEESLGNYLLLERRHTLVWDGMNHAECDVIVVTLPQVLDISIDQLSGKTVIDVWRSNRHLADVAGIKYIGLGLGPKTNGEPIAEISSPVGEVQDKHLQT